MNITNFLYVLISLLFFMVGIASGQDFLNEANFEDKIAKDKDLQKTLKDADKKLDDIKKAVKDMKAKGYKVPPYMQKYLK